MDTHFKIELQRNIKNLNHYFLKDYTSLISSALNETNKEHIDYFKQLRVVLNDFSLHNQNIFRMQHFYSSQSKYFDVFHSFLFKVDQTSGHFINCFYGEIFKDHIQQLTYPDKKRISNFNNAEYSLDVLFASLSSKQPFDTLNSYLKFKQEQCILRLKSLLLYFLEYDFTYSYFIDNVKEFVSIFDSFYFDNCLLKIEYFSNFKFAFDKLKFKVKYKDDHTKEDFINAFENMINTLP